MQSLASATAVNVVWLVNAVALFFSIIGAWLLLATRWREQRQVSELMVANGDCGAESLPASGNSAINRFFYSVAGFSLLLGVALSWFSTTLG